jgi:hypothetical protein
MVTVKEIKKAENSNSEIFYGLIVQSAALAVKSKQTGRVYLTAKTGIKDFKCFLNGTVLGSSDAYQNSVIKSSLTRYSEVFLFS